MLRLIGLLTLIACADSGDKLSSFAQLSDVHRRQVVVVRVAPVAVVLNVGKPGEMYPEPCDPTDPAIAIDGRAWPGLHVMDIPADKSGVLNLRANAETANGKVWTCVDLTMRIERVPQRKGQGLVEAHFIDARDDGSRPVDRRLLGGD